MHIGPKFEKVFQHFFLIFGQAWAFLVSISTLKKETDILLTLKVKLWTVKPFAQKLLYAASCYSAPQACLLSLAAGAHSAPTTS